MNSITNTMLWTRDSLKGNAARLITIVVIAFLAFYAFAFVSIYSDAHSYETSSRWIFENVPAGSKIAGVHWDDHVPVSLPGYDASRYIDLELPLYEPDTQSKWELVTRRLADADYIALPTQRLQGSLLRVPDEYPISASFFRQLFAGQLGFRLIKTIKKEPTLLGITFDDDTADESISVYDHPKVSIFRNFEHLGVLELQRRLRNPPLTGVLPSLRDIMRQDMPVTQNVQARDLPQLAQLAIWLVTLEVLTWILFPFIAAALPHFPDRGFGASRTLGFVLIGLLAWQLSSYGLLALTQYNLWGLLLSFGLATHLFVSLRWGSWSELVGPARSAIRGAQTTWYMLFAIFLVAHSFQPEIFWGEKPMDFTFLNYFVRLDFPPPQDPWAAGESMHYYYLGSLLFALVHKLGGIAPSIGYNLALVSVAAMIGTSAYSIFMRVGQRRGVAILSALGIVLIGNLEVIRLVFFGTQPIGFDLFWASTRLFTSPSFAEYPLWSILFADLHAHVISIPVGVSVLALFFGAYDAVGNHRSSNAIRRILLGATIGSLFLINTWDMISYGAIFGVVLLFRALNQLGRSVWDTVRDLLIDGFVIALVAFVTIFPFLSVSAGAIEAHYDWVQKIEFNNLRQVLCHLGLWVIVLIFNLSSSDASEPQAAPKILRKLAVLALALFPVLLGIASLFKLRLEWSPLSTLGLNLSSSSIDLATWTASVPWDILLLASTLIFSGGFIAVKCSSKPRGFLGVLAIGGGLILAVTELVFLNDRMNTIFKFYSSIWILLGISSLGFLPFLLGQLLRKQKTFLQTAGNWCIAVIPVWALLLSIAGSMVNLYAMTTFTRIQGPRPTLDGQAYLEKNPEMRDDYLAIQWLNSHITGTPVMLEAQGDSYREFSRITMHTGLPTVLGWEYHVQQRGTRGEKTQERKREIRAIYDTPNPIAAFELLRKYNVQIIVVGGVETKNYDNLGLQKFDKHPELFPLLFHSGSVSIYTTSYSKESLRS